MTGYDIIRAACLAQAERYAGTSYAKALRHIALDCDYAAEGDPVSAQSVAEFLAGDHELDMALYPDDGIALAPVQSTIGMGIAA